MLKKLLLYCQLFQNMGMRYTGYRIRHELEKRAGVLKKRFPVNPPSQNFITLENWRKDTPAFFFQGNDIPVDRNPQASLKKRMEGMEKGIFRFFSKQEIDLGTGYDWLTNPDTSYTYDSTKHWSEIPDFAPDKGDIKYVWEKARFGFITDVIRYDYHFQDDRSGFVFGQIDDFIAKNPINQGPNYRCSQEISLRILNWTLALNYYKDSPELTEMRFNSIMNAIYWQLHHVYHHIDFSRIAVRNNHAITETLMLYLSGLLFPFMPETKLWSKKGKQWLEEEVAYQIYKDGTFLQFTMNYHRIVVQLLTWGLRLAELHNETFAPIVRDRAAASLKFLDTCIDPLSGQLPNYGNNDGALFFKWTEDDYRVYTSQINDLRAVLYGEVTKQQESQGWYGLENLKTVENTIPTINRFEKSGYYILQEGNVKTFLRCGGYKDRPFQNDNLHLDVWQNGVNYLWDTGTYKYNTDTKLVDYFTGCEGHNTLSVADENQMLRGSRFIWFYWIKKAKGAILEQKDSFVFEGEITAFQHVKKGIKHQRTVTKKKGISHWVITDKVANAAELEKTIYWHVNPSVADKIKITCVTETGEKLEPNIEDKWYSGYYGVKTKSLRYSYRSKEMMITTIQIID